MKNIVVFLCVVMFSGAGFMNFFKQKALTGTLDEITLFINFVKTQLRFHSSDYGNIYEEGREKGFRYIGFENNYITLNRCANRDISSEFESFVNAIGTTDREGQLSLCDEYRERFYDRLIRQKSEEKQKIQVNTALSLFGALSVIIFFM